MKCASILWLMCSSLGSCLCSYVYLALRIQALVYALLGDFIMKGINNYLQSKEDIQSILSGISGGMKEQLVAGLSGSARSLLISILNESIKKPILIITYQLVQAQQLYDDLSVFMGEEHVHLYPVNELIASEIAVASPELRSQRIDSLGSWT